jgi:hypothetical protein
MPCHIRGSNRGCIRGWKGGRELSECRKGNGDDGGAHVAGVVARLGKPVSLKSVLFVRVMVQRTVRSKGRGRPLYM